MTHAQIYAVLGTGLLVGGLGAALIGATMLGLYLVWGLMGAMVSAVLIPSVAGLPRIGNPVADVTFAAALGAVTMTLIGPAIA
jgi:hypothetical protein